MTMKIIHISFGGPEYWISVGDKVMRFEDHHYCGPSVLGRDGDPLANQPPESSPFWEAVNCWYQQGKVTETICGRVFAKWVKPTMPKMIHLGGNHYMLDTSELKNASTEEGE